MLISALSSVALVIHYSFKGSRRLIHIGIVKMQKSAFHSFSASRGNESRGPSGSV
jgi:hypothetical protein